MSMQPGFYKTCLLAGTVVLSSITNIAWSQKVKCPEPHGPGQDIYKHYKGFVGNKLVCLDLRYGFCGGSNYGGSTFYMRDGKENTNFTIFEPKTYEHKETLTGEENRENDALKTEGNSNREHGTMPRWVFKIDENKLTGKWNNADKTQTLRINMREDYSSSYAFDIMYHKDAVEHNTMIGVTPASTVESGDAAFIQEQQLQYMSGHDVTIKTWNDYFAAYAKKTANYLMLLPAYNENGFLVLEKAEHNNYFYLCLDVKGRKVLGLSDILNVNKPRLSALLEAAIRKKYNLDKKQKLSTWFYSDKIPVTENVMMGQNGIVFCYNKGLIAKPTEQDNIITVFLSYEELKGMLRPEIKARLGKNR